MLGVHVASDSGCYCGKWIFHRTTEENKMQDTGCRYSRSFHHPSSHHEILWQGWFFFSPAFHVTHFISFPSTPPNNGTLWQYDVVNLLTVYSFAINPEGMRQTPTALKVWQACCHWSVVMSSHAMRRQCISKCTDECAKFWLSSLQLYNSVAGIVVTNRAFVANVLSESLDAFKNSAAQFR